MASPALVSRSLRAVSLGDADEEHASSFHWRPTPKPYLRPMTADAGVHREVSPDLDDRTLAPEPTEEAPKPEFPNPCAPQPAPPRREAPLSLSGAKFLATSFCGFTERRSVADAVFVLCRVLSGAAVFRGERLCDEGEKADVFFIVLSGTLNEADGARLTPGSVVHYDQFCLNRRRPCSVFALEDSIVAVFDRQSLDRIGCRDAHVLSCLVRAAAPHGADQF